MLNALGKNWGYKDINLAYQITDNIPFHEAGLLKLNCDKALYHLKWESNLFYSETINLISDWYLNYYEKKPDMYYYTIEQISYYEKIAIERSRTWTKENIEL